MAAPNGQANAAVTTPVTRPILRLVFMPVVQVGVVRMDMDDRFVAVFVCVRLAGRLKWHWGLEPASAGACIKCGQCEDKCTQHLPIIERLKYIAGLE